MTYLHCPRCRLAIKQRVDFLTLTNCPRCLARTAIAVPLFRSPLSAADLRRHEAQPPLHPDMLAQPAARRPGKAAP